MSGCRTPAKGNADGGGEACLKRENRLFQKQKICQETRVSLGRFYFWIHRHRLEEILHCS